jgi:hypothetical protein
MELSCNKFEPNPPNVFEIKLYVHIFIQVLSPNGSDCVNNSTSSNSDSFGKEMICPDDGGSKYH